MTQIEIPSELPNILRNFTLSVLRKKPRDIIDHAVDYFTQLQQQQRQTAERPMSSSKPTTTTTTASSSSFTSTSQSQEQQEDLQSSNHNVLLSGS